jgi:hypothetical protein
MIGETKTQKTELDSFFAGVLAAIGGESSAPESLPEERSKDLTVRLNSMITGGASFEVGANDFQITGVHLLTASDSEFLRINKDAILYVLQQAFLNETLFKHSAQLLADFQTEVFELQARIDDGEESSEVSFEAAREIIKAWFVELLRQI